MATLFSVTVGTIMKRQITIIVLFLVFKLSSAQELKTEYQEVVKTFVECIKNNNTDRLQTLIAYPLRREYPLSDVKDEHEFQKRYNEIFDDSLKEIIIASNIGDDWSSVGCTGVMLNNGTLWLDYDGRLIGVNYQSNFEKDKRVKLIKKDKKTIHESIKDFEEPILIIETEKFRIRIDELSSGEYRYSSWSINFKMNEKPDLIIENGNLIREGSGGNHRYEFRNGNYKYECSINFLGTYETPPANLLVSKNEDEILNQPAQIIRK